MAHIFLVWQSHGSTHTCAHIHWLIIATSSRYITTHIIVSVTLHAIYIFTFVYNETKIQKRGKQAKYRHWLNTHNTPPNCGLHSGKCFGAYKCRRHMRNHTKAGDTCGIIHRQETHAESYIGRRHKKGHCGKAIGVRLLKLVSNILSLVSTLFISYAYWIVMNKDVTTCAQKSHLRTYWL